MLGRYKCRERNAFLRKMADVYTGEKEKGCSVFINDLLYKRAEAVGFFGDFPFP